MLSSVRLTIWLLQEMAWRRIGHKPLSHYMNQWRLSSLTHTHICIYIYTYIWSKVNIWNVNNSIHFRHTNGCSRESVKVFETENISTGGGVETPTYQGQTFTVPIYISPYKYIIPRVDRSPSVLITLQQVVGTPNHICMYIYSSRGLNALTCVTW